MENTTTFNSWEQTALQKVLQAGCVIVRNYRFYRREGNPAQKAIAKLFPIPAKVAKAAISQGVAVEHETGVL